ncbi:hypothetical protein OIN59_01515 [Acidovorax sp. D2M1]|uniref:Uncharacterized protein n=1 Tax=Acidovorax benzenivorans TaxID=2987520 RepID=A0ABT5RQW6_9BURK|nr:hypothetical protein [Acidovorax benzenivorans]MDD2176087.1 hypothetical protein [Acidovorax benzenivorans]
MAWQPALAQWLGWAVLVICLAASGGAGAQPKTSPAVAQADKTQERLLAQQVDPTDSARFAWGRAAEAVGQGADAIYLRLALADDWLRALEGAPAPAGSSIEAAIARGRELDPYFLERRARAAWTAILQAQQLRAAWDRDGPEVPRPPELDALGAELVQEGPGLWVRRAQDGRPRGLYLWLGVRNALAEPLPLPEFALQLGRPGLQPAAPLTQCALPRYSTRQLVPPQSTQHYLCSAAEGGYGLPPAGVSWLAQMGHWFSQGAALQTVIPQHDQALSRTVRILVQVDNPAVDGFLRGLRESAENQQQQQRAQATAAAASKAQEAAAARRAAEPQPLWLKRLIFWGGVLGALVLYGLLAHHVSVAVASGVLWLGLAIPSAIYLRSIWTMGGTDGWGKLVAIVLSGAAIAAPFVGTLAAYTAYKLVVSAQARRKAILFLLGVIVVIVLNALERWLFW